VLPSFPTNRYCVHDSKYGAHTRCCKGHVYDQRKNVCCNGIQPLVANYTWCCGGLMYNPKYHVCCPDNVIRYNVYFPYTGCCGSIVYRSDSLMLVYLKTVQCACLSVIRIYSFYYWYLVRALGRYAPLIHLLISALYTPCSDKKRPLFLPLTLSNANRFSKFFHRQT